MWNGCGKHGPPLATDCQPPPLATGAVFPRRSAGTDALQELKQHPFSWPVRGLHCRQLKKKVERDQQGRGSSPDPPVSIPVPSSSKACLPRGGSLHLPRRCRRRRAGLDAAAAIRRPSLEGWLFDGRRKPVCDSAQSQASSPRTASAYRAPFRRSSFSRTYRQTRAQAGIAGTLGTPFGTSVQLIPLMASMH